MFYFFYSQIIFLNNLFEYLFLGAYSLFSLTHAERERERERERGGKREGGVGGGEREIERERKRETEEERDRERKRDKGSEAAFSTLSHTHGAAS